MHRVWRAGRAPEAEAAVVRAQVVAADLEVVAMVRVVAVVLVASVAATKEVA